MFAHIKIGTLYLSRPRRRVPADQCLASLVPSNPPDFQRDLSYSYFGMASIGASKWNHATGFVHVRTSRSFDRLPYISRLPRPN